MKIVKVIRTTILAKLSFAEAAINAPAEMDMAKEKENCQMANIVGKMGTVSQSGVKAVSIKNLVHVIKAHAKQELNMEKLATMMMTTPATLANAAVVACVQIEMAGCPMASTVMKIATAESTPIAWAAAQFLDLVNPEHALPKPMTDKKLKLGTFHVAVETRNAMSAGHGGLYRIMGSKNLLSLCRP